jgi:hypothetical protein
VCGTPCGPGRCCPRPRSCITIPGLGQVCI